MSDEWKVTGLYRLESRADRHSGKLRDDAGERQVERARLAGTRDVRIRAITSRDRDTAQVSRDSTVECCARGILV